MKTKTTALTAVEVRAMLTEDGIDHTLLTITDDPTVWTNLDTGRDHTSVRIQGPAEPRRRAFHALFNRHLSCAPYPDYDDWSRG